ncbi:3-oxoacyl-[acyl-carrier-protein] reductase FabG [Paraliobacillus ryukyuensis]|uniref:3-oxoacyl-[acyl-carrier protein] reductase n=1 Tax=Paraliobacillus ryukyuensis TaxID=200904 RepID=A0A366EH83_9BACI|nr:SDR family oxidoreductase [Paraliobacillus ryukyuensis]RBP01734.1 3-oxoacyl-[acyl-carrier protein] reductase [Paraliobacillus ryukyuensis]
MDKHCLIIGASGDIGKAVALQLARDGYTLSLHYHTNRKSIDELLPALPNETVVEVLRGDLSTGSGIEAFINSVSFVPSHLVFANGQAYSGLFQETPKQVMDELFHVHVKALWLITQFFLPTMIRNQHGNIIVISSIWGNVGASSEVIYSSVKGAQNSFVKALAKEVASSNIRVNAVSPGLINTKMNADLSKEEVDALVQDIPANRMGKVEEVADLVTFLCQPHATYINGENINIDGAW